MTRARYSILITLFNSQLQDVILSEGSPDAYTVHPYAISLLELQNDVISNEVRDLHVARIRPHQEK
jgi:hypothetical protein